MRLKNEKNVYTLRIHLREFLRFDILCIPKFGNTQLRIKRKQISLLQLFVYIMR